MAGFGSSMTGISSREGAPGGVSNLRLEMLSTILSAAAATASSPFLPVNFSRACITCSGVLGNLPGMPSEA